MKTKEELIAEIDGIHEASGYNYSTRSGERVLIEVLIDIRDIMKETFDGIESYISKTD